jgi:hypothetical protein
VYRKDGVFLCSHEKPGWAANNPPTADAQTIEIAITYAKLGINRTEHARVGIALAVTDATGDARQQWFMWPPTAHVGQPDSWGQATLE